MRRDVAADLEHELVAVAQHERARVAAKEHAVPIEAHAPRNAASRCGVSGWPQTANIPPRVATPSKPTTPDGIGRPEARATARDDRAALRRPRATQAERGRDDHDAAIRKELDVHALRRHAAARHTAPCTAGRG